MASNEAFKKKVLESLRLVEGMDPSQRAEATSFLSETVERLSSPSTPKTRKTLKKKIKVEKGQDPVSMDTRSRRQTQTPKRFSEYLLEDTTDKKCKTSETSTKKSSKKNKSMKESVKIEADDGEGPVGLDDMNFNATVEVKRLDDHDLSQFLIVKVEDPNEDFAEGNESYTVSMEAIEDPDEENEVVGSLKQIITVEKEKYQQNALELREEETVDSKAKDNVVIVDFQVHSEITNQRQLSLVTEATCIICAKVFASKTQLQTHYYNEHCSSVSCTVCAKEFPSTQTLANHCIAHYDERSTTCLTCGRDNFKDHKMLKRHSRVCVGREFARDIQCPWCGYTCLDVRFLRDHARYCTGQAPLCDVTPIVATQFEGLNAVCDVCREVFPPMTFVRHRYQHYHSQLLKCRVCCRSFKECNSRLRHERTHDDYDPDEENLKIKREISRHLGLDQITVDNEETVSEPAIKKQDIDVSKTGCGGELPENYTERIEPKTRMEITRMIYDKLHATKDSIEESIKLGGDDLEQKRVLEGLTEFLDSPDFDSWLEKLTGRAEYECMLCSRSIPKVNFRVHLMTHLDIRPFQCIDCHHAFVTRQHLINHITVNINPRNIRCLQCPKLFKDMRAMQRHYLTHAKKNKDIKCDLCHKLFRTKRYMHIHRRVHEGGKYRHSQCDLCGEWFSRQYIRDMHRSSVCPNNHAKETEMTPEEFEKKVSEEIVKRKSCGAVDVCHICNKTFSAASHLKLHLMKHRDERNYLCELCDKKFLTKGQLQKHQYAVHEANKSVECEVCGKVVKEWYLQRHARTHDSNRERPHQCPICGMSFMDAKTLRNHSELHTRSKSHACDICDHSFTNPHQLQLHKKKHRNNHDYSCQICGQGFITERRLQQHYSVHTRDRQKPHACPTCNHRYSTRRVMVQHALREHGLQLDRYGCIRCGETFGSNKSLCMQHVQACFRSQKINDRKMRKDEAVLATDPLNNPAKDQIAQEVLTQLASMAPLNNVSRDLVVQDEVILENAQPGVQYIIVDPEGNVLETLDVGQGEQVHIEAESLDHEVVTYTLPLEEADQHEVYASVDMVKDEQGSEAMVISDNVQEEYVNEAH